MTLVNHAPFNTRRWSTTTKFMTLFDRVGELQAASVDVINVKAAAYGAVGDGVTDDAPAIQSAIDAIPADVGAVLYFPPGVYRLDSDLYHTSLYRPITLRGSNMSKSLPGTVTGSVLYRVGAGNCFRLMVDGAGVGAQSYAGQLIAEDMTFAGDGVSQTTGLAFYQSRVSIRDCSFTDLYKGIDAGWDSFGGSNYNDHGEYRNLFMRDITYGGMDIGGCDGTTFAGMLIGTLEGATYGLKVKGAGFTMQDIIINGPPLVGLYLNGCTSSVVLDMHYEGTVGFDSHAGSVVFLDTCSNTTLLGFFLKQGGGNPQDLIRVKWGSHNKLINGLCMQDHSTSGKVDVNLENCHAVSLDNVRFSTNAGVVRDPVFSGGAKPYGQQVFQAESGVKAMVGLAADWETALWTVTDGGHATFTNITTPLLNGGKVSWAAAAPTTGAHSQGEVVFNTGAVAEGTAGWICTTAGTPGTWKTFGVVSA